MSPIPVGVIAQIKIGHITDHRITLREQKRHDLIEGRRINFGQNEAWPEARVVQAAKHVQFIVFHVNRHEIDRLVGKMLGENLRQ